MSSDAEKLLDATGRQILQALQENARVPFAELGRQVGLSPPAVAERVRKLEEAGIITGYHAEVNAEKVSSPVTAFIRISVPASRYPRIIALLKALPEVLECHHVTGNDSFIMKVAVPSMAHLEPLIGQISRFGETTTSIVLSSPVVKRSLRQDGK